MRFEVAGQNALITYFGDELSEAVSAQLTAAANQLSARRPDWLVDLIPSYASLLVIFDLDLIQHAEVQATLRDIIEQADTTDTVAGKQVTLPVYYSEQSGPDLARVAENAGLSIDEVVKRHQAITYRVYAIGFAPGFAYLGEIDERLATPRLDTPRLSVPKGSVAIADRQTAVYPAASPGGWNLIGLCPTPMFNPAMDPPMPLASGDLVTFEAISQTEFLKLGGKL